MDSSYFGLGINSERGNGPSSASCSLRKGKKSNSVSEKPKQPQRGLGVAQLEKIRLHGQLLLPPPPYHHHHPPLHHMGLPEYERTNIIYGDSQSHPTNYTPRWDHVAANTVLDAESNIITRPFLNLYDSQDIDIKKQRSSSSLQGSNSQNSESSNNNQVLDLELRLSL